MSIRTHVVLWFLLLVGVILAVSGYVVDRDVSLQMEKTARVVALDQSDAMSSMIRWELSDENRFEELGQFFDELTSFSHIKAVRVFSWPEMTVLYERGGPDWLVDFSWEATQRAMSSQRDWFLETVTGDGHPCSVLATTYPPLEGDHGGYLTLTATDRTSYQESHSELRRKIVNRCMWILLLTALAAVLMGHLIAKPLKRLAVSVNQVEAGQDAVLESTPTFTELSYLRGVLEASYHKLRLAFERQARFTADASHELRTPVATARTVAEVALLSPKTIDEYQTALQSVNVSMERLTEIIEALLIISRADAGKLDLRIECFPLEALIDSAVALVSAEANERSCQITVSCPPDIEIECDRKLLVLLFRNLLSNAIRYGPEGGLVNVKVTANSGHPEVLIDDEGSGIPLDQREQLFERFARGDHHRARESGGSGLGLAIVHEIAVIHGLLITIDDSDTGGARFRVAFPDQSLLS